MKTFKILFAGMVLMGSMLARAQPNAASVEKEILNVQILRVGGFWHHMRFTGPWAWIETALCPNENAQALVISDSETAVLIFQGMDDVSCDPSQRTRQERTVFLGDQVLKSKSGAPFFKEIIFNSRTIPTFVDDLNGDG